MTAYQYIKQMSERQFRDAVRLGIIPARYAAYVEIFEWWNNNGRSEIKTAAEFKQSRSNIGSIIRIMKKTI